MRQTTRRTMLRKLIPAALLSLAAGPAAAQVALSPFNAPEHRKSPEEIAKQKAIDNAYKSAMDKIPEKKAGNDPWGNLRDAPPTATKPKP